MKKKTVWSLLLALAMTVTAIGASTAAFAAAPNQAEPQTLIATENEDAIWEQIEALEGKSDAVFQRNEACGTRWTMPAMPCLMTTISRTLTRQRSSAT